MFVAEQEILQSASRIKKARRLSRGIGASAWIRWLWTRDDFSDLAYPCARGEAQGR